MKLLTFALAAACRHFSTRSSSAAASSLEKKKRYFFMMKKKKKKSGEKKTKIEWTDEQKQVLEAVRSGQSIFVTGSAGTGKTFLLEQIIKELKKIQGRSRVYVTASTGVAACALNGQTLHSFAGIGQGAEDDDDDHKSLLDRVLLDVRAQHRWRKARALCIDEISMISANLFEGLEYVARTLRHEEASECDKKTWGGLQLIVCGDFFQLPPIIKVKRKSRKVYAFEADCWNASFDLQMELTQVFRQSDSLLIHLLQGMRKGKNDPDDLKILKGCCSGCEPDSTAVKLFPRIADVRRVNKGKLESLDQKIYMYKAQDLGEKQWIRQFQSGIVPDELELCVGARVMLIKNINPWRKLVNGATGTVMDLCEVSETECGMYEMCSCGSALPLVKFDCGLELVVKPETWVVMDGDKIVARRRQIPLILSWALSIHKCQGMTLDKLHTDLSRVFGFGMVYVALSRIRSLAGLSLSGLDPLKIKAHPNVLEFYKNFNGVNEEILTADNGSGIDSRNSCKGVLFRDE